MIRAIFGAHGQFCSSHPWEVIVTSLISTIYFLSTCGPIGEKQYCSAPLQFGNQDVSPAKTEIILLTLARCMAVLCIYNRFKNLWQKQCNFILGVATIFTAFSGVVFNCAILFVLGGVVSDLIKALPFFLLMTDLSKVGTLTRVALSASMQHEVRNKIAIGMSDLGPTITLDTIAGTLAISIGTLSGVKSLEDMSFFACLAVLINYFIFMTFLPSCLSLSLELMKGGRISVASNDKLSHEKEQKRNPALQRVKVIMSAGLVLVHAHCRWILPESDSSVLSPVGKKFNSNEQSLEEMEMENLDDYLYKWLNIGPDQLVVLGLTLALVIKYIFYENHEDDSLCIHQDLSESAMMEPLSGEASKLSRQSSESANSWLNASIRERYQKRRTESFIVGNEIESVPEVCTSSVGIQTENMKQSSPVENVDQKSHVKNDANSVQDVQTFEESVKLYKDGKVTKLSDEEVIQLVKAKHIPAYNLEIAVKDCNRGIAIRRKLLAEMVTTAESLKDLPHENYNYAKVAGACCENVVGYMPVPVGIAGPMLLDDKNYHVPMATTEGCLVASVNRGFRALVSCGGIRSSVVADGMSRAPVVRFPSSQQSAAAMSWLKQWDHFLILKTKFDSTSRFARLEKLHVRIVGRYLFIRFIAKTGDAMGMNMLSKGTEASLETLQTYFGHMEILSLSGNYCSDKKPAAINWIEGRGKSVVCEAVVPENVVKMVLKTSVQALIDVNISKNLVGSALAGSIGGFNAQAANVVAAIFIATGQDAAQVVTSANCMTLMEPAGPDGQDLYITVTMPSIEIGTVGGGTMLPAQSACLKMLDVHGSKVDNPGWNATTLATVVCGAVLAGELSLISALSAGHLVRSHMRLNRLAFP